MALLDIRVWALLALLTDTYGVCYSQSLQVRRRAPCPPTTHSAKLQKNVGEMRIFAYFFVFWQVFFSYLCTCQLETGTALQATNPIDCVRGAIARCHLEISQKTKGKRQKTKVKDWEFMTAKAPMPRCNLNSSLFTLHSSVVLPSLSLHSPFALPSLF